MSDLIEERWANIKGTLFGLYEVSDQGHFRCLSPGFGRVRFDSFGIVELVDRLGQKRTFSVAAVVLEAFAGERPRGMWIEHRNGDTLDNRLSNLRWTFPIPRELALPKEADLGPVLPDVWRVM